MYVSSNVPSGSEPIIAYPANFFFSPFESAHKPSQVAVSCFLYRSTWSSPCCSHSIDVLPPNSTHKPPRPHIDNSLITLHCPDIYSTPLEITTYLMSRQPSTAHRSPRVRLIMIGNTCSSLAVNDHRRISTSPSHFNLLLGRCLIQSPAHSPLPPSNGSGEFLLSELRVLHIQALFTTPPQRNSAA